MKLNQTFKLSFILMLSTVIFTACSSNDKPLDHLKTEKKAAVAPNPFSFYKSIEIKPGFNFEIVSWGKGVDTLGGYLILMSDSVKNNYKSLSGERKGMITDAWNMDLDNDGNPELYIQYVVRKNVNDLNVYEFSNNNFEKISFPGLTSKFKNSYQGNDKFFIKSGELFRSVPIITTDSGKTTTVVKTLQYNLRGNSFSSSER